MRARLPNLATIVETELGLARSDRHGVAKLRRCKPLGFHVFLLLKLDLLLRAVAVLRTGQIGSEFGSSGISEPALALSSRKP